MANYKIFNGYNSVFYTDWLNLDVFKNATDIEFAVFVKMMLHIQTKCRIDSISAQDIANDVGCCLSSAEKAMKRTVSVGLVSKHKGYKSSGVANYYSIDSEIIEGEEKPRRGYAIYKQDGGAAYRKEFPDTETPQGKKRKRHTLINHKLKHCQAWKHLSPTATRLLITRKCFHKKDAPIFLLTQKDAASQLNCGTGKASKAITELLEKEFFGRPKGGNKNEYYLTEYGTDSPLDKKHGYKKWKPK